MARMKCPVCGGQQTRVKTSNWRQSRSGLRRLRECQNPDCGVKFPTYEIGEDRLRKLEATKISLTSMMQRVRHMLSTLVARDDVDDLFLTEAETARLIGIRVNTLVKMRVRGIGPTAVITGAGYYKEQVRYKYIDVVQFMEQKYGEGKAQEKVRDYETGLFEGIINQQDNGTAPQ